MFLTVSFKDAMLGKHQYAPATRASDISRLLDPSYTSASGSPYQTVVYVDHSGDFHDPDYRDFPVVQVHKESRWDPNYSTPFDEDEEEQEERDEFDSRYHRFSAYRTPTGRRSSSRPRSPGMSSIPLSPTYSPYPQYYSSSPSQSYEEESEFSQSPPENPLDFESEPKRSRISFYGARKTGGLQTQPPIATTTRLTRVSSPMSRIAPIHDGHEEVANLHKEDDEAAEEQDLTPTCSMAMRRQWQAFRLFLGLGVFRAQRRIRRKVGI